MGGARCSYRTCTVKSDKKTHMFHYPVFDKLRCHQWITNAQKLNFLDLKLSQLKNRMVCEHHFTEDSFMNAMKAKLKHTAVPTLDGPFCTNPVSENINGCDERDMPIIQDDIENDYLTNAEKKLHFSVKYVDFLTNDLTPLTEDLTTTSSAKSTSIMLSDKGVVFSRNKKRKNITKKAMMNEAPYNNSRETNLLFDSKAECIANDDKNFDPELLMYKNKVLPNPKVMNIAMEELNFDEFKQGYKPDCPVAAISPKSGFHQVSVLSNHKATSNSSPINQNKKVKIISEEKISEPLILKKVELQHISPLNVLKVPDVSKKIKAENCAADINTYYVEMANQQQDTKILDNMQRLDNVSTISSQPITNQMCLLNEYSQPTMLGNKIDGLNNLEAKNIDLFPEESKQMYENMSTDINNRTQLQNIVPAVPMVLNIEFVPTTVNQTPDFTLSDVPQVSTHLLDSSSLQHNVSAASLISKDSEILRDISVNTDHAFSVPEKTQSVTLLKNKQNNIINKKPQSTQSTNKPNKSFLKSKMPPEKLAAIEEKRKFNMKLRDIVNSCLSNLDDESESSKLTPTLKKDLGDKKVVEHLSSDPNLPNSRDYNISYLEARLQRMEDALLNKIDQNSQKIADLKKTVVKPSSGKKCAFTQTYPSTESTKRYLYQQISQFLSPEANSLVYEELFLNVSVKSKTEPLSKKRKR